MKVVRLRRRRFALILAILVMGICLAGSPGAVVGQTLHVLLSGDTNEPTIGPSVKLDLRYMTLALRVMVPTGQQRLEQIDGERVSRETIRSTLQRCPAGPDDAVLFFWSGHGARDEQGHFLVMPGGGRLHRQELIAAARQRQPRLVVILTDCCDERVPPRTGRQPLQLFPAPSGLIAPLADELFFRVRGLVDINACAEGEVAVCNDEGGLFTLALAYPVARPDPDAAADANLAGFLWRHGQERLSWQSLVQEVGSTIRLTYQQMFPEGYPRGDGGVQRVQTLRAALSVAPLSTVRTMALRPGDRILTVNGRALASMQDYWNAVKSSPTTMTATVLRQGKVYEVRARLNEGGKSRFGVAAQAMGTAIQVTEVFSGYPGEHVQLVRTSTLAALVPGDVILGINGAPIRDRQQYWAAVKGSPAEMELTVRSARTGQTIALRMRLREGSDSRSGVVAVDNGGDGVRVTEVWQGYPGAVAELVR